MSKCRKHSIRRRHQPRKTKAVSRRRKTRARHRRIIYGGSGAIDAFQSYSASPLNPGWAITGVNNFQGPTQVPTETHPSGMV